MSWQVALDRLLASCRALLDDVRTYYMGIKEVFKMPVGGNRRAIGPYSAATQIDHLASPVFLRSIVLNALQNRSYAIKTNQTTKYNFR